MCSSYQCLVVYIFLCHNNPVAVQKFRCLQFCNSYLYCLYSLQDGPHSLDDSMSALLSSSSTGTRKKSMGTHYKRPGPPTPSKNGGRLSFGSSEPPREILREFGDHNNTSKTPARFKFLTQRFSVGSSGLPRDEVSTGKIVMLLTCVPKFSVIGQ